MMRSVCFVDRLEFEFSGNHFPNAITIGDVDNDGLNELCLGNVDGVLAIFKGDKNNKPWKKCSGLGMVTCVGVGDIFNTGTNAIVVINAESQCHLFVISSPSEKISPSFSRFRPSSGSSSSTSPSDHQRFPGVSTPSNFRTMKPVYTLTLKVPNVKIMCITKLLPGGPWDLYVGQTDRGVSVYHWNEDTKQLDLVSKFSLSGQIGSLSVGRTCEGTAQLLISQPGGTYVPLTYRHEQEPDKEGEAEEHAGKSLRKCPSGLYLGDVIGHAQRRNPTSSTEVVGGIIDQSDCSACEGAVERTPSNIVALCTVDGVVRLLKDREKQWELQVDHSLFAIGKLDVTGSGSDEIVVCAWDGSTYIVDHNRNCVRFRFDQNVSAFFCGYYGVSAGVNVPCLVYMTFSNWIYVYHDVTLRTVLPSNLLLTLQNKSIPSTLQEKLNSMDSKEKQELFSQCLYTYKDHVGPCGHNNS